MIDKIMRLLMAIVVLLLVPTVVSAARATSFDANITNTEGGLYVVNCREAINLRTQPSFDAEIIMEIPLGEMVKVIDDFDASGAEFAHVTFKGVEGWAPYKYLTPTATLLTVVNCQEYVNLRSQPYFDADVITTIPLGEKVRFVRAEEVNFYYVYYRGNLGYVNDAYVAKAF